MANGLDPKLFELSSQKLNATQHAAALAQLKRLHCEQQRNFLGFQANQERFSHLEGLEDFLYCQLNNLGDPFADGNFTLNSKCLERAVLDYYAKLWRGRPHQEKDPDSCWGYVLTMGSTEGNLYGLWNAREYLSGGALLEDPSEDQEAKQASTDGQPRRPRKRVSYSNPRRLEGQRHYQPVIFFSEDTHYSIYKAVKALRIKTFTEIGNEHFPAENPLDPGTRWPDAVPTEGGDAGTGSIDCEKLAILVEFFAQRGYPILVFFNYGTTFKGAYDDVEAAGNLLMPIFERHGLDNRVVEVGPAEEEVRHGFWFHVDGALGAAYMPFLELAYEAGLSTERGPNFDFRLPFVHSIVMSGHKWIGAPWPCGIYMTRTRLQLRPPDNPEYIGALDTTFAGSRNGFSALLLWNYLARTSHKEQIQRALHTQKMAQYALEQLEQLQKEKGPGVDLWVARSPCSLTIRFKQADEATRFRFSLSGESYFVDGRKRSYSHIFAMPHVTKEMIDALIEELRKPDAFPVQPEVLEESEEGMERPLAELRERLAAIEELLGRDLLIRRFAGELVFRSPRAEIVRRFHLETEALYLGGRKYKFSRLGSDADLALFEEMLQELGHPEAFDPDDEETEERLADLRRRLFPRMGRGFK